MVSERCHSMRSFRNQQLFCLIANFENSFKSENTDTDMTVNFFPHEKPRQKQVQNADKGRP